MSLCYRWNPGIQGAHILNGDVVVNLDDAEVTDLVSFRNQIGQLPRQRVPDYSRVHNHQAPITTSARFSVSH